MRSAVCSSLRENLPYLLPCLVFWIAGSLALVLWGKVDVQVFLNGFHTPFQDAFWVNVTAMGGTVFCLCVLLTGSLFSYRYMVSGIVSILCTMALVALLKHAFDAPRPLTVLTQAGIWDSIVLVEGHPLRDTLSFPSGHTAAAFSLFTTLALFATRWWIKMLLFFAALAVAYSRIYLMQHFLSDVLAGSFLATVISVAVYLWAREARWIDFGRPLVSLRRYGRPENLE